MESMVYGDTVCKIAETKELKLNSSESMTYRESVAGFLDFVRNKLGLRS